MSNTDFKLSVDDGGPDFKIVNQERVVAVVCGVAWSAPSVEAERDAARRLVACWNACEGISTEVLESEPYLQTASYAMRRQAEARRDELIAAMEEVLRISDRKHEAWDKVKAMIAEIKQ